MEIRSFREKSFYLVLVKKNLGKLSIFCEVLAVLENFPLKFQTIFLRNLFYLV